MIYSRNNLWLLILILFALGASSRAQELEKPTSRGNVTIAFPKGWTVDAKGRGRPLLVALPPKRDQDASGEFQASFSVSESPGGKVDGAAQQARLAKEMKGYKVQEPPTAVTVSGLQGVYFGGTFTNDPLTLRSRQYMFTQDNQLYVITFTCLESAWPAYLPSVEASVATFTLKK